MPLITSHWFPSLHVDLLLPHTSHICGIDLVCHLHENIQICKKKPALHFSNVPVIIMEMFYHPYDMGPTYLSTYCLWKGVKILGAKLSATLLMCMTSYSMLWSDLLLIFILRAGKLTVAYISSKSLLFYIFHYSWHVTIGDLLLGQSLDLLTF